MYKRSIYHHIKYETPNKLCSLTKNYEKYPFMVMIHQMVACRDSTGGNNTFEFGFGFAYAHK